MTTCLGKSCSFSLPRVPFVNCCQFMYLVTSLLVLRAGCGILLYRFLILAYLFTFQRFAVSLLHFRSILTAQDLKIGFSTNILPSLPNMGSSASALPFCLDCKRSVDLHSQRCERTSALPWLPKFCLLSSAIGSYYVFPHNFVLSYMKD